MEHPCRAIWHFLVRRLGSTARGGGVSLANLVRYRLAGWGAPVAWHESGRGPRQGSGLRPAAGVRFGFSGEFSQAAPCDVSLSGLPADPGRTFERFPAVPHGTSILCFPALRCRNLGTSLPPFGASPRFDLGRWRGEGFRSSLGQAAGWRAGEDLRLGWGVAAPAVRRCSGFASFETLAGPICRRPGSSRWLVDRLLSETAQGPRTPTSLPWKHGRSWEERDPRLRAQLLRGRP